MRLEKENVSVYFTYLEAYTLKWQFTSPLSHQPTTQIEPNFMLEILR